MIKNAPSSRLFLATERGLAAASGQSVVPSACARSIEAELGRFFRREGQERGGSLRGNRFQLGLYGKLGSAPSAAALRDDLLFFCDHQGARRAPRDFFAVFQPDPLGEREFLHAFRAELSHLAAGDALGISAGCRSLQFTFSLEGRDFFVSALHPLCPEQELRFRYPTLVFRAGRPGEEAGAA